jgi:ribonuclease P protein component
MQRRFRLHRSTDIQRVRRTGKSYAHPLIVLLAVRNPEGGLRAAVVTSRTIGKAVERNFTRRRIRTALQSRWGMVSPGWDLLWIARPAARTVPFAQLDAAVESLLRRAGVLDGDTRETDRTG